MQGVGPGSVLGGRYTVTLRTSEGVHHERWRASDHTLEREVVLVCFTAGSSVAAAALDAARRAAGVEDPRLVRVLDVGSDQGVGFIVEEPLTGAATMADLLGSGGLPAEEVRRLVGEAASALDKARQRGLHHLALTPGSVLRMADGAVKVRGIATDAALIDADSVSGEQASRLDAIGLVKLIYAGLTARWPAASTQAGGRATGSRGAFGPGGSAGSADDLEGLASAAAVSFPSLDAAPTIVGGVAPPSEIAVGVPNDLDLICRMTLNDDRGPISPGDLAMQIAPWASTAPTNDGGSGIGLTPTRAKATPRRQLPALPRRRRSAASEVASGAVAGAAVGASAHLASPAGAQTDADADATAQSAASATGAGATGPGPAPAETAADGPDAKGLEGTEPNENGTHKNIAAAGAAMAGVAGAAGAIGDRVGSFARAAADKASAKAAERRAAHALDDEQVEDIHLDEALDEAPVGPLEPPIPGFARISSAAPSKAGSRLALSIIGVLVVVLLVIGINNVMKIGQSDPSAAPVVKITVTRPPTPSTTAPTPTTTAPTTTTVPAAPVTITGGSVLDPGGVESNGKVGLAYDGNPATTWTSRWYGTPDYNGKKDGIGIVLDLDRSVVLTGVDLVLPAQQDVTVYAANSASIAGAQKIGSVTGQGGTVTMKAPAGLTAATKLIVWVTKAAPAEAPNHYRAQISEVTVR